MTQFLFKKLKENRSSNKKKSIFFLKKSHDFVAGIHLCWFNRTVHHPVRRGPLPYERIIHLYDSGALISLLCKGPAQLSSTFL